MLRTTTAWWNALLETSDEFAKYSFPSPFDDEKLRLLQSAICPDNRWAFRSVGDSVAGFGTLSEAAVALGYAFARTFVAGATAPYDPYGGGGGPGEAISEATWDRVQIIYSPLADWHGYVEAGPWWDSYEYQTTTLQYAVRAVRWAYRDQVKRWGAAVGTPIEKSIALDLADVEVKDFVELLFDWGGRILEAEKPWTDEEYGA